MGEKKFSEGDRDDGTVGGCADALRRAPIQAAGWFAPCIRCGISRWVMGVLVVVLTGCRPVVSPPPEVSVENLDRAMVALVERSRSNVVANAESADAWGRLGQVYHSLEFSGEAKTCYARASQLSPTSGKWLHLLALVRLQDEPEAAVALLRRAAERSGPSPDISWVRLLQALVERGQLAETRPVLDRLLAASPNHAVARLELGRLQLGRQELAAAAENLFVSSSNRLTRKSALLLLGQVRQRQGDESGAEALIREANALERPPDWPDPYLAEVQALRIDRNQMADQINAHLVRGRLTEAATGLRNLLAALPNDPEGLLLLGRLRFLEKKCPEAEEALRRHLAVQPNSLNGQMQLSLALLCQNRWSDAVTALRGVLAIKPEFAPAHANLGYALARAGDSDGAIRSYREALRFNPGDAESHFALSEELGLVGRKGEAMEHLSRAVALAPDDPRGPKLRERFGL